MDDVMMEPGRRTYKSASCRVAMCDGVPDEMRDGIREIVSIESGNPRKGHGTGLMHSLFAEADAGGLVLLVQPGQYAEGMTTEQLARWYGRFGFVELPRDEGGPVLMARQAVHRNIH